MTPAPGDDHNEASRQRTRQQFALLRQAHGFDIITDTDDPADFNFMCASDHLLLPALEGGRASDDPEDQVNRLRQWFADRQDQYGAVPDIPAQPRTGLSRRFPLPTRVTPAPDGKDVLATLAELDADPQFGPGFATPDHLLHICPKGTICPATEPTETTLVEPWPPKNADPTAGAGVKVIVIDTGWYDPRLEDPNLQDLPWEWLRDPDVTGEPEPDGIRDPQTGLLRPYAGHGTFVAGVIRSMAPKCEIRVLNLLIDRTQPGGGVLESELVDDLYDALNSEDVRKFLGDKPLPDLINMSAGCPTRLNLPLRSFETWRADLEARFPDPDLVLVASAGNNSSPWEFWPASFEWATGVGSLDRDGSVSSFSNWGDSVDVYALGRNVVNAFPNGTYVCNEHPDRNDERVFDRWTARWSGTSFSAPLVTGWMAALMSAQQAPTSARQAQGDVLAIHPQRKALKVNPIPVVRDDVLRPQP